jgi:SAM-dependent methyltransferase
MSDVASGELRKVSHGQEGETPLEWFLARRRYRWSLDYLTGLQAEGRPVRGLDLGCGYRGAFVELANQLPGVEFLGADLEVAERPELLALDVAHLTSVELPFVPDVVTMHAVLEHLEDDAGTLRWVHDRLAPGGVLLATVPSWQAKPVLEFLAFRLGVISAREIGDHKRYYDRASLLALAEGAGLEPVEHRYFQVGFNNWLVARKPAGS